jgi:hypothetical protein
MGTTKCSGQVLRLLTPHMARSNEGCRSLMAVGTRALAMEVSRRWDGASAMVGHLRA